MIIHHQNNVAAFAGGYTLYWVGQPLTFQRISVTPNAVLVADAGSYVITGYEATFTVSAPSGWIDLPPSNVEIWDKVDTRINFWSDVAPTPDNPWDSS